MVVSLIGPSNSNRVQRVLLVAAYAGIQLKLVPITEGVENSTEAYRRNCHPLQETPVLKTAEGYLFECHAMIRYLGRTEVMQRSLATDPERTPHPDYPVPYALYGHTLVESCLVDAWLDFAATRLDAITECYGQRFGSLPLEALEDQRPLWRHLGALEGRLQHLKQCGRSRLLQEPRCEAEDELVRYSGSHLEDPEVDFAALRSNRDARLSSVYNVADFIRHRMEEHEHAATERELQLKRRKAGTAPRPPGALEHSLALSPRSSTGTTRDTLRVVTPRGSVCSAALQCPDLYFLVGDSLTAADLVVAMALHAVYGVASLRADAVSCFPVCHQYYTRILTLPVARDVCRALEISLAVAPGQ